MDIGDKIFPDAVAQMQYMPGTCLAVAVENLAKARAVLGFRKKILKDLEWLSERQGPSGRGNRRIPGMIFPACPVCGGVKPEEHAKNHFSPEDIGHSPDCGLSHAIKG